MEHGDARAILTDSARRSTDTYTDRVATRYFAMIDIDSGCQVVYASRSCHDIVDWLRHVDGARSFAIGETVSADAWQPLVAGTVRDLATAQSAVPAVFGDTLDRPALRAWQESSHADGLVVFDDAADPRMFWSMFGPSRA